MIGRRNFVPRLLTKEDEAKPECIQSNYISAQKQVRKGNCFSIVELETSWEKERCIHVELGNFIFFPIWFRIVLYINRLFVIVDSKTKELEE